MIYRPGDEKTGHSYWEYVEQCEGPQIWDYLAEVWEVMQQAVRNGLEARWHLARRIWESGVRHPTI